MLLQPGVVGRALDREVERDLDAGLGRARDEPVEVGERPELGIDRRVAAFRAADRPRAPGIVRTCVEAVVAALAERPADRVDRRQIDDVEPVRSETREQFGDAGEPAPRAREQLVPAPEPGALAVDDQLQREDARLALARGLRGVRRVERLLERQRLDAGDRRSFQQLAGEILLPALELAVDLPAPGRPAVDPGGDRELPAAERVDREDAVPAIVPDRRHRRLAPSARAGLPVANRGPQNVVPVAEDVCPDVDAVADRALDRVAAAVEHRPDTLDLDSRPRLRETGHVMPRYRDPAPLMHAWAKPAR